jgi:hypothetical protein
MEVQGEFAHRLPSRGIYDTATQNRPGRRLRLLFDCGCGLGYRRWRSRRGRGFNLNGLSSGRRVDSLFHEHRPTAERDHAQDEHGYQQDTLATHNSIRRHAGSLILRLQTINQGMRAVPGTHAPGHARSS